MMMRTVYILLTCVLMSACQNTGQPPVTIKDAWSPATPPGATVAAAYLQVTAIQDDELLSASTPAADAAEMHSTVEADGVMRMRPLESAPIAAGETLTFRPGGSHFMLMGLKESLAEGATYPLTLRFRQAGEITIDVLVRSPGESHTHH